MIILGIETSCDETAMSIIEVKTVKKQPVFNILSNIISSQVKIHREWGGVVPMLAKREHLKNLPTVLKRALEKASAKGGPASGWKNPQKKIDAIAVTVGPGLEPALWTGINFAEELAKKWNKPIIPINHMEGHIVSALLPQSIKSTKHEARSTKKSFGFSAKGGPASGWPAMALLVSGGHTELVLVSDKGGSASGWKYKIIGQTLDDAAGEAFDKVAKMLGLPYPGGPVVAKMATNLKSQKSNLKSTELKTLGVNIKLPRPMMYSKNYDFSFSGLKTAVLYLIKNLEKAGKFSPRRISPPALPKDDKLLGEICHEFQQAVIDVLISKTMRAVKEYKVKTIILGGGVSANKELRKQLKKATEEYALLMPDIKFTGDNAVMIAAAAYFHTLKPNWENKKHKLKANGNLILK